MIRRTISGSGRRLSVAMVAALMAVGALGPGASAWDASTDKGRIVIGNVKLNGLGSQITVAPGATVTVDLDYRISDPICTDCYDQIQVGFHDEADFQACAYDGLPGPDVTSGHAQVVLTAPTTPGPHYVAVALGQAYYCGQTGMAWSTGVSSAPRRYIGRVSVGTTAVTVGGTRITRVSINGGNSDARVKAGTLLSISFRFSANQYRTLEVGWAHQKPVACVDGGKPTINTATSGFRTVKLRAPTKSGSWFIAIDPNLETPGCDFRWATLPIQPEQQFIAHVTTR